MSKNSEYVTAQMENAGFIFLITVFAVLMRFFLFPFESGDFHQFLQHWYSALQENGGFAAVGMNIGDYMPTYLYLLAFFTYLPVSALQAIKLISTIADIVLAVFVMKTVNLKFKNNLYGIIAYSVTLFLPSVFLNSAVWGQCDAIYTAALVAFVYYFMKGRDLAAVVGFSIAFVFKLQAVFLAPLLLFMVVKKKIRPICLLIIPLVYFIAIIPAVLLGRSFSELMTVYFAQSGQYSMIAMYLPNLYTWLPDNTPDYISKAAVILAGALVLLSLFCLYRKKFVLTNEIMVTLALFFALFVPFLLPHMHERYDYPAVIFSFIFAFYFPKKLYLAVATELASAYVVCHNLFDTQFFSVELLGVIMLAVILQVGIHLVRQILANPEPEMGVPA